MSDRCRLVIEVRVDEVGLFEEHLDGFDEIREEGNTAECIIDEASGTMECEIRELALKHNLTFCGWHEEGAEWNPGLFAACGGFVVWVDSNIEKIVPVIELQPDLRMDYDKVAKVSQYYETQSLVNRYFAELQN